MAQNNELKGKDILVTGGAGFIGSNIVDQLAPDNNVVILDNLFTGSMKNLEKSQSKINFVKGNILDKKLVADVVSKVEYVFHLAGHVGNIRSLNDPYFDMDVNIRGMINLMEACRDSKVKKVVYSSSAAGYGEAKYLPVDEEHPLYPESPYAVSKLAAEKYAFSYHKVYGIPTTALRYFNIYGPRQDNSEYANAVSIFMNKIKNGEQIIIYGDGNQTRDFLCVYDIVNANILAAVTPDSTGQVFNIATGEATSINRIKELLQEISGEEVKVNYLPARAGEILHSRATIEKAKKVLGFAKQVELKEGLSLTWEATIKEG